MNANINNTIDTNIKKICNIYPGSNADCINDLPYTKIKIVISIILIIGGIIFIIVKDNFIYKLIVNIITKLTDMLGILMVFIGFVILNSIISI